MSFFHSLLSSLNLETIFALLFLLVLSIFLLRNKEKIKIQKIVFPFLYMILYKAKWGIKSMDNIAKKHPRFVKIFSSSSIYLGILGMILIFSMLSYNFVKIILTPTTMSGVAIAQPFVKTSFGSPFFYIPFSYFIIAIFIIATIHEFSHGVVARYFRVKIKSSGFAFFAILIPILPAAFVEPEDKEIKKLKAKQQMAIFAAGPMSNIFLAVIIFLLMSGINTSLNNVTDNSILILNYTTYSGDEINGMYPAQKANVSLGDKLVMLDNTSITSINDFVNFMDNTKSNQQILLTTNSSSYNLTLDSHPQNSENGYLGLIATNHNEYTEEFKEKYLSFIPLLEWFLGLIIILFLFNLGVGLMNLAPIGGLDGGQMILAFLKTKYSEKEAISIWSRISTLTLIILLGNILLPMIMRFFI
jgi:membrane-associated protease RseP (regulator of RpoE activity)